MQNVMEGTTPTSNRPQSVKRRKRIANLEAQRQRRIMRARIILGGIVVAAALYAFSIVERMVL